VKIFNTYTRKKEDFKPITENKVKMYVCGPTVYDYIHIGNARPLIFFDVVNRYFKHLGYDVNYVSNITDVDDKIINKAQAEGVSEIEVSKKYLAQYLTDCSALNVLPVCAMPKVTENMDEIISFINTLVEKGFAYEVEGDVYFRVNKATDYGKLSGKKIEDLIAGARVEANIKKENPLDFTLWKKTDVGITWKSPWGLGRPGWHTECVVMIDEAFGGKIDIHGGGPDLPFPHHENEIAQSICAHNHTLANYWMHVGRLALDGEKMSKSLGNVVSVKDLLEEYDANVFRLFLLSMHYKQPITFSYEVLEVAKREWEKVKLAYNGLYVYVDLNDGLKGLWVVETTLQKIADEFYGHMDDDFNTANGVTCLYELVKEMNKLVRSKGRLEHCFYALYLFEEMLDVLGFNLRRNPLTDGDKDLFRQWEQARVDKNFELADELRGRLQERELI